MIFKITGDTLLLKNYCTIYRVAIWIESIRSHLLQSYGGGNNHVQLFYFCDEPIKA